MFDGVCGQVHLQAGSICVTTVTVVALVRLIFVVLPTVRLQGKSDADDGLDKHPLRFDFQIHTASTSDVVKTPKISSRSFSPLFS